MNGIGGSTAAQQLAGLGPWPNPAPPITREERLARLAKAQALMTGDAMIIGAGASLRYFAGVGWNATERLVAMLLPKAGQPVMICPRFEQGSLIASLGIDVIAAVSGAPKAATWKSKVAGARSLPPVSWIGFESGERSMRSAAEGGKGTGTPAVFTLR